MFSTHILRRVCAAAVLTAATVTVLAGNAHAELMYGITDATTSSLVSFDSTTPGSLTTVGSISGLVGGQTLTGIDFRPSNGQLYAVSALGTAGQLYTVNLTTGVLTAVGSGFTLTGNTSTRVSMDFNPVADAVRIVTGSAQSYRINATTGALIAQDTSITPADLIADVAYSNNLTGGGPTTLYAYDYSTDTIGTIGSVNGTPNSPNGGVYTAIGTTGIVTNTAGLGFDISGATGIGYLNADIGTSAIDNLYRVNFTNGSVTSVGSFGTAMLDISVRNTPVVVPEAGTFALIIPAALGALVLRRRRKA